MKKLIARVMIVAMVLSGLLAIAPAPSASAHHMRGHHCRANPHRHPGKKAKFRHRHRHHRHQCNLYPPRYTFTAAREL